MEIEDYLKSLNPQKDDQAILLYNSKYHVWLEGEYLGIATWTKDENAGDSFQNKVFDEEAGYYVQKVYVADKWELVINNDGRI